MQKNFRFLSVLALTLFITFTACKKDEAKPDDSTTEMTTEADDQSRISGEMDAVANDINLAVEGNVDFGGRVLRPTTEICGATLSAESSSGVKKLTIAYAGGQCGGQHVRTGTVVVSMPSDVRWRDAGAELTVEYKDVKITRRSDNKSITINGTGTFTNVSGGRLIDLATQGSITHTHHSTTTVKFEDGTERTWQVARQRVFTYDNGIVITVTGLQNQGTNSGIAEWGTNRFGKVFATAITQPLVIRQDCNFRITSGQVQHQPSSATVTFGLNADGIATSCPGSGSYYYKLSWTGPAGKVYSFILPY